MAKTNDKQSSFMYENRQGQKNVNKATSVHPTALPPLFREKSRFLQKVYIFIMVVALAMATGVTSFVMLDGFAAKSGIISGTQIAFLIMSLVMWFITIGGSVVYVWWGRTRSQILTFIGTISVSIPSLALAAILLYLDLGKADPNSTKSIDNVFFVLGISGLGVAALVVVVMLGNNLIYTRFYRDAKFRSLWTAPGFITMGAAPLILWLTAKGNHFRTFGINEFIYSLVVMFGGAILLTIGIMVSMKYKFSEAKSTTSSIKLSGSLPTIIIFVTLLTISLRFVQIMEFGLPLIITIVVDIVILALFGLYLFFKARIKNIGHTNPLFNVFVMKSFIITTTIIGLIMISMLPNLMEVKSYAPLTFGMLGITSLTIIAIVLLAHFTNLIVFEKFVKSIVISAAVTVLVILMLVFVLGTLNETSIIMQITSRSIAIVLLIAAIIGEVILLLLDIAAVHKDVFLTAWFIKKKKKNEKEVTAKDKKKKSSAQDLALEENIAA